MPPIGGALPAAAKTFTTGLAPDGNAPLLPPAAASLHGITALESLLPAVFHLLLALAIRKCRLNNPMMATIAHDLRQRHVQPS